MPVDQPKPINNDGLNQLREPSTHYWGISQKSGEKSSFPWDPAQVVSHAGRRASRGVLLPSGCSVREFAGFAARPGMVRSMDHLVRAASIDSEGRIAIGRANASHVVGRCFAKTHDHGVLVDTSRPGVASICGRGRLSLPSALREQCGLASGTLTLIVSQSVSTLLIVSEAEIKRLLNRPPDPVIAAPTAEERYARFETLRRVLNPALFSTRELAAITESSFTDCETLDEFLERCTAATEPDSTNGDHHAAL